jgi:acyl-CoA synthetase (NDP forming)
VSQQRQDIVELLHPRGVAIIGQVNRAAGEAGLRALNDARYGPGGWHLVNPKGGAVGSLPIYSSVAEVPGSISLAVISAPPRLCAQIIEECGARGIGYAVVFSSGFSEVGGEGAAHERALAEAGRRAGVRILGPNTNTNLLEKQPEIPDLRGGKIGVVTQSGHNGRPIVQGSHFNIGFTRQIPCGNECDLDVCDFMEYFAYDDETSVIAGYIEGFRNPDRLRRALAAAMERGKPVVLLKMGSTSAGSRMASSHTGHLTGSDAIVDGLFRQYGVVRVRDLDELLETAALFARLPRGTGARAALYSISGGSGTLMAESAELAGVSLPKLSASTQEKLYEHLPRYLSVANPVDNGGTFITGATPEVRRALLDIISEDPAVDLLVVGVTGAVPPMSDLLGEDLEWLAKRGLKKPIIVTWNSPKVDEPGFESIVRSQLPLFRSFRNCFGALRQYAEYAERQKAFRPRTVPRARLPRTALAALEEAGAGALPAAAARALLESFKAGKEMGFPVAMKISSPDFPHKSDAGLVRLGVSSAAEARSAYEDLLRSARKANRRARVEGVLVQEMITDGVEMIIGLTRDPVLGPAVMVGMGGVFTEILKDVAVRPIPLDSRDAREMVESLRGYPLLRGARGRAKVDVRALVAAILQVGRLAHAAGDRIEELDLNPVLVRPEGVRVVDQLVIVRD